MSRAFSEQERDWIRARLRESARELFAAQGLRKTSLEEIVGPAGIVKSSFYQFFDSKESLYLDLMMRESGMVKQRVIDEGLNSTEDPREGLRRFLHATVRELTTNPLWQRLTSHPDELHAVARRVEPAPDLDSIDNATAALTRFVSQHQQTGELIASWPGDPVDERREIDPDLLIGVLQVALLVPFHGKELGGPERLTRILDLLIDVLIAGLTREGS